MPISITYMISAALLFSYTCCYDYYPASMTSDGMGVSCDSLPLLSTIVMMKAASG